MGEGNFPHINLETKMAKDIKVIFHGNKSPSGKNNETEYMINSEKLKQLNSSGMFDIEVISEPKVKPKKKKTKKEKSDE